MAWPPTIPTATRTALTDQATLHHTDHNQMSVAMTDVVARITGREVGYAETFTAQSGIGTTLTTLTGLSVSFTAVLGRKYKLTFGSTFIQSTTAGHADIWFLLNAGGLSKVTHTIPVGNFVPITMIRRTAALTGAVVITVGCTTTAGTLATNVGAGVPAYLLVEDIGGSV